MQATFIVFLAGAGTLLAVLAVLAWRSRQAWPALPEWTWDDLRKLVALLATVLAAGILTVWGWWQSDAQTAILVRVIDHLAEGKGGTALASIGLEIATTEGAKGKLLVVGLLLIILSLGLVIGPRLFRFKGPGGTEGEIGGGAADPAIRAAKRVTAAAAEETRDIESEAKE